MDEFYTVERHGVTWLVPLNGGRWIPLISGGAPDDDEGGSGGGDGEDDDTDEEEEDEEEGDEGDGEEGEEEVKNPKAKIKALEGQVTRLSKQKKKLKSEKKRLLGEIDDLKKNGTQPDEETKEIKDRNVALENENKKLNARLLVLDHPECDGLPPNRRKIIVNSIIDELEIDEDDGENNLDELIEDLKEKDPDLFSVGKDESDDEEEDEGDGGNGTKKPKKQRKVRRDKKTEGAANEKEIHERFPALRGRKLVG